MTNQKSKKQFFPPPLWNLNKSQSPRKPPQKQTQRTYFKFLFFETTLKNAPQNGVFGKKKKNFENSYPQQPQTKQNTNKKFQIAQAKKATPLLLWRTTFPWKLDNSRTERKKENFFSRTLKNKKPAKINKNKLVFCFFIIRIDLAFITTKEKET